MTACCDKYWTPGVTLQQDTMTWLFVLSILGHSQVCVVLSAVHHLHSGQRVLIFHRIPHPLPPKRVVKTFWLEQTNVCFFLDRKRMPCTLHQIYLEKRGRVFYLIYNSWCVGYRPCHITVQRDFHTHKHQGRYTRDYLKTLQDLVFHFI